MNVPTIKKIERMIYVIKGVKVMLDSDLAELYQVETGNLNKAVLRNIDRSPKDFMFELTRNEFDQIKGTEGRHGGRRKLPKVFTESGIAMLSGVLNSKRAIQVNISFMRTFVKLRRLPASDEALSDRVSTLEEGANKLFRIVFERLDT